MKIIDNKGRVQSNNSDENTIRHSIGEKTELSKKANSEGLAKRIDKGIQSPKETASAKVSPVRHNANMSVSRPKPKSYKLKSGNIGAKTDTVTRNSSTPASQADNARSESTARSAPSKPLATAPHGFKGSESHNIENSSTFSHRIEKKIHRSVSKVTENGSQKANILHSRQREILHRRPAALSKGQYKPPSKQAAKAAAIKAAKAMPPKLTSKATVKHGIKFNPSRLRFKRLSNGQLKRLKFSGKKYTISTDSVNPDKLKTALPTLGTVGKVVTKPAAIAGNKLMSQRANFSKSGSDTGTEMIKLGLQSADYARRGARGIKTAVQAPRKIYKGVKRTVNAGKRTVKTAKNAAKAVKATAKATKAAVKGIRLAAKAAVQVVKATVQLVHKIVSLIVETAPWSLIIIGAILLLILIMFIINSIINAVEGSVTGVGGWAISDSEPNTPEDIYQNLERYLDDAEKAINDKVQKPLKETVKAFCDSDTEKPRKIIEYKSDTRSALFFPAKGKDSVISGYIDDFDIEFYPDFLATLFVLMTRDKQNAEGISDTEIFDFDFKRKDFEDFLNDVNKNSCKYGSTYVYKTTEEIPNCTCPGEDCRTKTTPGCRCDYWTDDDGRKHYYCGGHPYCPSDHTKLQVKLYTVQEYYETDLATIYNFSVNERARFESTKEFIQALIDDYGGEN